MKRRVFGIHLMSIEIKIYKIIPYCLKKENKINDKNGIIVNG